MTQPITKERQRRRRAPSVTAAIKQALRAGVTVTGATVSPDGSVSLTFGQGQGQAPNAASNANEWDVEYGEAAEIH